MRCLLCAGVFKWGPPITAPGADAAAAPAAEGNASLPTFSFSTAGDLAAPFHLCTLTALTCCPLKSTATS